MPPLLWISAGTNTHQQHGGGGCVNKKVGRPRRQHSERAEKAWLPGVNHLQHGSLPHCSTHQNTYKVACTVEQQLSKHRAYVSVRAANTGSSALACRVCGGRGSEPEKVLYAVADAEVLVEQYAVGRPPRL